MQQLIMRWVNDGAPFEEIILPDGFSIKTLNELENGIEIWLDIIKHGLTDTRKSEEYYNANMLSYKNYTPDKCFFILYGGKAIATITVICDDIKKEGYIHMVACHEDFRGRGIGTLLNKLAMKILKTEEMQTAYLTTDDWRIPAIKSYFRAGFYADESTDDFKMRWASIREKIKNGES